MWCLIRLPALSSSTFNGLANTGGRLTPSCAVPSTVTLSKTVVSGQVGWIIGVVKLKSNSEVGVVGGPVYAGKVEGYQGWNRGDLQDPETTDTSDRQACR